jgi:hypothetical protein
MPAAWALAAEQLAAEQQVGIGRVFPSSFRRVPAGADIYRQGDCEQLEATLHEKDLNRLPGVGPRRLALLRAALAQMLARVRAIRTGPTEEPSVEPLLDVDREYRSKAKADQLKKIATKRFNPLGEAWLPILHTRRGKWHFTALFSNTARAHELGRVRDWVVMYFHSDSGREAQRTVVTETRGILSGQRVVRGRERESLLAYEHV